MGSSTKDLLALSEGILSNRNPIKGTAAKVDPIIDDERLETLVETLKKLLRETKDVMQEMTSCGMIGVNLSGKKAPVVRRDDTYPPKPKKKKNGSNRINKGIKKRS